MPTCSKQLDRALASRVLSMFRWTRSDSLICRPMVSTGIERGHRVLEDHGDLAAADVFHLALAELQEITPAVERLAAGDLAGRDGDQAQDRHHGDGFSAAALADDRQGFALVEVEGNAVDGIDRPFRGVKAGDAGL